MVEKWKFGKGLLYGSTLSLGFWIILIGMIETLVK
ncbi:putative membrane protein [Bacillus cereus D17]|nr:putative membrane protein [Bacillus cereus D17]